MANTVQIVFTVNSAQAQAGITQIQTQITGLGSASQGAGSQIDGMLGLFRSALIIEFFRRGASEAFAFGKAAVDAFNEAQAAALGLQTVARSAGVDPQAALQAVQSLELVKNGMLTVSEASTALKNNLRTGFSLEQSIDLIKQFGDAAAFNKQSAISFGDAVVRTSEGIRQNLSTLADAGGITTNLSVILGRAGLTFDDLSDKVNGAANTTKFYNELLKETAAFQGDAARRANTFAGQTQALEAQQKVLMQTIGEIITNSPELQSGLQAVGDTLGYITSQLKDSDSELAKFVDNSASRFGVILEAAAKLARGINAIAAAINFLNPSFGVDEKIPEQELKNQKDAKIANDKLIQSYKDAQAKLKEPLPPLIDPKQLKLIREANDALTDLKSKLQDDPFKALDDASARREREFLQRFKDAPDQVKDSFRIENAKLLDAEIAKLKVKQDKEAADTAEKQKKLFQDVANASADLQAKLSTNPLSQLFTSAAKTQAEFLTRFKDVPKEMLAALVKFNTDALSLDIFKAKFSLSQSIFGNQTELAKLQAGFGGADLRDSSIAKSLAFEERKLELIKQGVNVQGLGTLKELESQALLFELQSKRAAGTLSNAEQQSLINRIALSDKKFDAQAKLEAFTASALEANIASAVAFLSQANSAAEKQFANQQIIGLTGDIGKLTPGALEARQKALTDELTINQEAFKENAERLAGNTTAMEANTAALVKFAERDSFVRIIIDQALGSRTDFLPSAGF